MGTRCAATATTAQQHNNTQVQSPPLVNLEESGERKSLESSGHWSASHLQLRAVRLPRLLVLAGGGGQLQLVQLQLVQQGVGVAAVQLGVGVAGAELQLGVGVAAAQPPLRLASATPTGGGAGHAGRGQSAAGGGVALETGRGLTNTAACYSSEMEKGLILELQTIHRFSQSQRRPLLGPSPG